MREYKRMSDIVNVKLELLLLNGKTFINQTDLLKALLNYKGRCNEQQKEVVIPIINMILNITISGE